MSKKSEKSHASRAERRRKQRELQIQQEENITRRGFEYIANGVKPPEKIDLRFKLRNDIKLELEVFLGLLGKATKDVQEELNKFK